MAIVSVTSDMQTLVVCTCVLYIKFLGSTMIQGRKGFAAGTRPPEDKDLPLAKGLPDDPSFNFVGSPHPVADESVTRKNEASDDEARWKRIVQNDLECIPIALVVFLVAVFAGGNETAKSVLMIVFTVARVAHTVTYAHKRAILRMMAWMVSVLSVVTTAVLSVIAIA